MRYPAFLEEAVEAFGKLAVSCRFLDTGPMLFHQHSPTIGLQQFRCDRLLKNLEHVVKPTSGFNMFKTRIRVCVTDTLPMGYAAKADDRDDNRVNAVAMCLHIIKAPRRSFEVLQSWASDSILT